MSWKYWEDYPRSRPRRPADGIKAQTQRGKFGQSWWASRWLATLERLCNAGRLARGRSYARGGQVVSLEVGSDGVKAKVQGSRPTPYAVSIHFRTLSDAEWDRVLDAMAGRALYAAKLLSGEMPNEIEEVFTQVGASLLPAAAKDLITDCSCPDWANPCKHVAAVYYLLGERFDADPFLMFELRGRTKEALLAALRERRGEAAAAAKKSLLPPGEGQGEGASEEESVPLAATPAAAFWAAPTGLPALTFSFEPPAIDALAVKRLGAPPFWPDAGDFAARMEAIYRAIGEHARRLALGSESE